MTEFKPTHIGTLVGDARTGGKKPTVKLRETKTFWISEHGTKYRKGNGVPTGDDKWPLWCLDIESIKPL